MNKFSEVFALFVLAFAMVFGIALLISLPVMWLWNWVIPDIFGLKEITWTQALGLALLCGILFKSSSSSK